jgi:hypothetical protein
MWMFFGALMVATAANPPAASAVVADPLVCRRPSDSDTHSVGTRMRPKKVCKPKSEWQALNAGTPRDGPQDKPATGAGAGAGRQ